MPSISRASFEGIPFFYGCIPEEPSSRITNPHDQCVIQTIYEVLDFPNFENSDELVDCYITMGRFRITHDLFCGAIVHYTDFFEKNPLTKRLHELFKEFCKKNPEKERDFLMVDNYLSSEFAKGVPKDKKYEYKVSAAFTKVMTDYGFDGVIYPSAKGKGEGLYIAISPTQIEALNALKLVQAVVWRVQFMKNKPNDPFIEPFLICKTVPSDGAIKWETCSLLPEKIVRDILLKV